jgi:hypothetical protein
MGIVKRSRFDPTHENGEGDVDVYEVDVDTDANGDGSTQFNHDEAFDGTPTVAAVGVTDAGGDAFRSAGGGSQTTVDVAGSTADATVTVTITLVGSR